MACFRALHVYLLIYVTMNLFYIVYVHTEKEEKPSQAPPNGGEVQYI